MATFETEPVAWLFRSHWKDEPDLRDEWHVTLNKHFMEQMVASFANDSNTVIEVHPLYREAK